MLNPEGCGQSELAELYGVSRMTAGKVLGLLAAEGLIRRRRGSGSVVARQISWEQIPARPGTIISVRLPTASERADRPVPAVLYSPGLHDYPDSRIQLALRQPGNDAGLVFPQCRLIVRVSLI